MTAPIKRSTKITSADLIYIDEIGLLPVSTGSAEGLYRIVDAAYEKRSIAISPNHHHAGFDEPDAQNHRHSHRRPAPAPRTYLPNQQ